MAAGIRITARTQVGMAVVEYAILAGFAIVGFVAVLGHHHGTYPVTKGWFSLSGIGGKGSLAAGLLLAVFMYTGWGRHRVRERGSQAPPGQPRPVGRFRGRLPRGDLHRGCGGLAGRGVASQVAGQLVLGAGLRCPGAGRPGVGQGDDAVPGAVGDRHRRSQHRHPDPDHVRDGQSSGASRGPGQGKRSFQNARGRSILTGLTLIAILWAYLLSSSIAGAFTQLIDVTGILTAGFYILTALATIVYYRRRVFSNAWDALLAGILPFAAAEFLAWIVVRSLQAAPASQRWSVAGIIAVGVVLMLSARCALRSPFFQIPRDSASREP